MSMFIVDPKVILQAALERSQHYPYAQWYPLRPEVDQQSWHTKRTLIAHSMAGPTGASPFNLHRYASRIDVKTEPTLALGYSDLLQFLFWDQRADCNADANSFAVSWETQDDGSQALPITPWNPYQCEQQAGLIAFGHLRDGVPIALPVRWDAPGAGYHRLFGWPHWSVFQGKTCPGDARVLQWPAILARARAIVADAHGITPPPPPPLPQETDVKIIFVQDSDTGAIYKALVNEAMPWSGIHKTWLDAAAWMSEIQALAFLSGGQDTNGPDLIQCANSAIGRYGPILGPRPVLDIMGNRINLNDHGVKV